LIEYHLTYASSRYLNADPSSRDEDPLPVISALNLILQTHATRSGYRLGQNRYFYQDQNQRRLGQGIEAWQGFFLSVRPMYKQLMVCSYYSGSQSIFTKSTGERQRVHVRVLRTL
jgi:hypothetical protein